MSTESLKPQSSDRPHFLDFWTPRHRHYKMRGRGSVFGSVLIAAPTVELHDSLDTDAQGFQLLSNDSLRRISVEVFNP